jgi:pimeloyl-ACP methyl ester carboxylesterase
MKKKLLLGAGILLLAGLGIAYTPSIPQQELHAKYTNQHSQFVSHGQGLRVHYRDQGLKSGDVIVMLHGNSNSLHDFEPLIALLGEEYRIISLDFPGHGLTGAHPEEKYGYRGLSDALTLVANELGLEKVNLLGHSMGGWVAWRYAVDNPDFISSLILISASGMPLESTDNQDSGLGFRLLQSPVGPLLSGFSLPRLTIEKSMDKSVYKTLENHDQIIDRTWELLRHPQNRTALAYRAHESREVEKADMAKQIRKPTLLIWGDQDTLVPPSAALNFERRINGAQMLILPEVGHLPMLEATDKVAQAVREFLKTE